MDDFWSPSPRLQDQDMTSHQAAPQVDNSSQQSQSRQRHDLRLQPDNHPESNSEAQAALQYMVQDILNEAHRQNVLTYEELHARQQSEQRRDEIIETALWSRWQHQVASGTVLMSNEFILRHLSLHQLMSEVTQPTHDITFSSQQTQQSHLRTTSHYR